MHGYREYVSPYVFTYTICTNVWLVYDWNSYRFAMRSETGNFYYRRKSQSGSNYICVAYDSHVYKWTLILFRGIKINLLPSPAHKTVTNGNQTLGCIYRYGDFHYKDQTAVSL